MDTGMAEASEARPLAPLPVTLISLENQHENQRGEQARTLPCGRYLPEDVQDLYPQELGKFDGVRALALADRGAIIPRNGGMASCVCWDFSEITVVTTTTTISFSRNCRLPLPRARMLSTNTHDPVDVESLRLLTMTGRNPDMCRRAVWRMLTDTVLAFNAQVLHKNRRASESAHHGSKQASSKPAVPVWADDRLFTFDAVHLARMGAKQ